MKENHTCANKNLKGYDKNNMDLAINPGEDFLNYASGNLLKTFTLRDDQMQNGVLMELFEKHDKQIQDIVLEYANAPQTPGSLGQKISSLYNQRMDVARQNKEGYSPLKKDLEKLANVSNLEEYQSYISEMTPYGLGDLMFYIGISADERNVDENIVMLHQGGLGLGNRDYYEKEDEQTVKVREAYKESSRNFFKLVGYSEEEATKKVEAIYAIEKRIALASYSNVDLRQVDINYHKMTYEDLLNDFPGINWNIIFKNCCYAKFDYINVRQLEPIHEVEKVLKESPLEDLKSYAELRLISSAASSCLGEDFRKICFEMHKAMSGQLEDDPLWKQATKLVNNLLADAIGQIYCEKFFPESSKNRMMALVENIKTTLAERIKAADWMGENTKGKALEKLAAISTKIGYPDKWQDYSKLEIKDELPLYENLKAINYFLWKDDIEKHLNKPVDRSEWGLPPQTVNAYYNPTENCICFPAGILQPPIFDPEADDALNYGGIGCIIGHEISHGFDDQGSLYDIHGNRKDWWQEADREAYAERIKVLEEHFDTFEVINGKKVNGKLTLGENIGDNGGINIALQALHHTNNNLIIEGLNADQRFFLGYARLWTSVCRPEYLEMHIANDVHSPFMARVNGALPHIDAWYTAFNIKEGDKLYIPKSKRAHVW